MTHQNSGYLQIGDGNVYFETAGEGEAVVLCHAGFVDSGMWDDQWETLAQRYHVIRYDMRGYGKSDAADGQVSHREELYRVLSHLGIERAHLIGCSMGGETIMDFALEYPEMVASLVVVSAVPSGFEMQGEPPAMMLEMIAALQQGDLERGAERQIRLLVDGPSRQPEQVDAGVRQRALEMSRIPLERGMWAAADAQPLDPPAAQRLHSIPAPTLIVVGALDDAEIRRIGGVMAAEIPGAKRVTIEGGAHMLNMEKPAEFNRAVLAFLKNVGK
jgi:pimeloyl-ACP methyl ester carboxylesterase